MENLKLSKEESKEINKVLKNNGISKYVIKKGIMYFLKQWKDFLEECKKGYKGLGMNSDEYNYSLDKRETFQDIIDELKNKKLKNKIKKILKPIDDEFRKLLVDIDICWIKGGGFSREQLAELKLTKDEYRSYKKHVNKIRRNRKKYFWYWGIIKNAKGEFLRDMKCFEYPYYKAKN